MRKNIKVPKPRYSKVSDCPPELDKQIKLVNLLPSYTDEDNWQLSRQFAALVNEIKNVEYEDWSAREKIETRFNNLMPKEVAASLIQTTKSLIELQEASEQFLVLLQSQSILRKAADTNRNGAAIVESKDPITDALNRVVGEIRLVVPIVRDDEGYNRMHLPDVVRILSDPSFPFERIRMCKNCSNIFWAKRTDAQACGKECSDKLSKKDYQTRNKEAINAKRQATYQSKKQQKAGKERSKNNGNL